MNNIWAIILAAGASTRMMQQKMLLSFNGSAIIENVITNVAKSFNENIIVVLGSHRSEIVSQIEGLNVNICVNQNYMNGMLSSVICGFSAIPDSAKAVLVFLGDQPGIPLDVVKQMIEGWLHSNKGIVIPTYNRRRGHPALIETKYRTEIENLDPEKGLRNLYQKFTNDILELECSFPEILRDIDTPEDYELEINLNQKR